jgi:Protein of unknown function (DUF2500).
MGFDFSYSVASTMVMIGFVFVFGMIIVTAIRGALQWNKNNHSPILTVDSKIVAKRMAVSHHNHNGADNTAMHHSSSSTTYYATFEVESGDRLELHIPPREYGMLAEGDAGRLTFQGTRYKGFERIR